ncbi:MAG: hypothetical protein ABI639_09670 [Thermoanaerobaculia bacterium]
MLRGWRGTLVLLSLAGVAGPLLALPDAISFKRLPGSRPQSAALLATTTDGGALPLRLSAVWVPDASRPRGVALEVSLETSAKELFAGLDEDKVNVELTLYEIDAAGGTTASAATVITFDRSRLASTLTQSGLRFVDRMPEGAGNVPAATLRALILCRESGAFALGRVEIPASEGGPAVEGDAGSPAAGWIELRLARPSASALASPSRVADLSAPAGEARPPENRATGDVPAGRAPASAPPPVLSAEPEVATSAPVVPITPVATQVPADAFGFRRLIGTRNQSAVLLASSTDGGTVPLHLAAVWSDAAGNPSGSGVEITLESPAKELFSGLGDGRATVEITVYALKPDGSIGAASATSIAVNRTRLPKSLDQAGLRFVAELEDLPQLAGAAPGGAFAGWTLRALVLCRESGAYGLGRLPFPAPAAGSVAHGPSLTPESGWIDLRLAKGVSGIGTGDAVAGTLTGLPTASPAAAAETAPSPSSAAGVNLPTLSGDDLRALGDLGLALREIYHQAVAGDRESAVRRLIATERSVLTTDPKRGISNLERATGRIIGSVERADPGLLLVLALFHQRTGALESDLKLNGLAQRNENLAVFLLERMAKTSHDPGEKQVAATALSAIALRYLERSAPQRAAALLERATIVGGDDPRLLIALAAVRTQLGESNAARALLDRGLAREPGNREALLRRALTDTSSTRSNADLQQLSEGATQDWIAILAYQERARRALAREDFTGTVALLQPALARYGGDSTLRLALAFAERSLGRRTEATVVAEQALATATTLAALAASSPETALAPRTRYIDGTRGYLVAQRHAAEQAAALRAAPLAKLLGGANEAPGPRN